MAVLHNGLLGTFTGPIGNIVGYTYKGVQCVRSRTVRVRVSQSLASLTQRAKFSKAIQFVTCIRQLLETSYRQVPRRMSPANLAMRHILKNAFTGSYPSIQIDFSKVMISRGALCSAPAASAIAVHDRVLFTWDHTAFCQVYADDRAILVVYCEAQNQCIFTLAGPERQMGRARLAVSDFCGQIVHTWLGFISADGKDVSKSIYTGELIIT